MSKFSEWVVKKGRLIYLFVIFLTILFISGVNKLKIESDILKTLPPSDPIVKLFNRVGETFKGNFIGMVVLDAGDVFKREILEKIEKLSSEYGEIEGITDVISIVNAMDIKKISDGLEVGPLLDGIPQDRDSLLEIKKYVLSKDRYVGTFVSKDARYTAIFLRFKPGIDKGKVAEKVIKVTEENRGNLKVYYGGFPLQIVFVSRLISGELAKLIPLAAFILALILALSFLNLKGVILPIFSSLIAIIWTLGLMGYIGRPLSIVSDIIPVILLAVGSAYSIHMLNRIEEEGGGMENTKRALSKVGIPIILTALTTFAGFISLISADLISIRDFGVFTSIGVVFALLLSLTLVPVASITLKGAGRKGAEISFIKTPSFLLSLSTKKKTVLILFSTLTLFSLFAIPRITREVNMIEYFKRDNPIRISTELIMDEFGGSIPLQIYIEGDVKDPGFLRVVKYLEEEIISVEDVTHPLSISDLICEMNELLVEYYSIPETREKVANLWILIEGQSQLETLVQDNKAVIEARVRTIETKRMRRITEKIDSILRVFPKEWVMVDRNSIKNSPYYESIVSYLAKLGAKRINFLLKGEDEAIEGIIKDFLKDCTLDMEEYKRALRREILSYMESEEADILVESEELREKLTENLVSLILKGKGRDEINSSIESFLPDLRDEEGKNLFMERILSIARGEKRKILVESLEGRLKKFIGNEVDGSRFKGIIFDLLSDKFPVPKNLIKFEGDEGKIEVVAKQTGLPLIYRRLEDKLLKSQAQSLLLALVLVFIMMTLLFRSFKGGLLSITPIVFTIIFNFGFMGVMGIPLDNATVMVAPIAIGIGIDYSIHVLSRLREEKGGVNITLKTTGRAVLVNALSVGLGFAVLLLADIVPLRRFGILVAITMLVSSISALLLIPVLYEWGLKKGKKGHNLTIGR